MENLHFNQLSSTEGGFVPLVIAGYYIGAKTVAIASGVAGGALVYWATH
jgi:lactobin A/cerein 7B family class IIb bacteriocin